MKAFIVLFLFLISLPCTAQDHFLSFEHYLSKGKKVSQIFAASFPEDENFLVFVEDKKRISVYNFDESGQEKAEGFAFPNFVKKYPNIGGYTYENGYYTLFLSSLNKKKWAIITIDFSNKSFQLQETKLDISGHRIFESLIYNQKQYLFTLKRSSSTIVAYILDTKGNITTQEFSFEDTDFTEGKSSINNLDDLFKIHTSNRSNSINAESPIALESSKAPVKFYQKEALVTMTVDISKSKTYQLEFNLEDGDHQVAIWEQESFEDEVYGTRSNSFIFENKFFVLRSSTEELNFSIYNNDTKEKLKTFKAKKGDPITFKNTPIIQEGGEFSDYREFEKTSKFLRKVSQSNPAIAVFKDGENYIITIGASKQISTGGPAVFIYGGGLAGAVIGSVITGVANATFNQYNAYSYTKSARFQMVLDNTLSFIPETTIPLNAFDNIKDFTQETPLEVRQTVFKYKEKHIWGALNTKNNKINFFTF